MYCVSPGQTIAIAQDIWSIKPFPFSAARPIVGGLLKRAHSSELSGWRDSLRNLLRTYEEMKCGVERWGPADLCAVDRWMERYQQADPEAQRLDRCSQPCFTALLSESGREAGNRLMISAGDLVRIHRVRHTYRLGEPVLPWNLCHIRRVRIDVIEGPAR